MSRYIDADKLHYARVRIIHYDGTIGGYNAVIMSAEIKDAPTADVQEVKHGKWRIEEYEYFTCSVCGESYFNNMDSHKMAEDYLKNNGAYKYCPWCGAKMDLQ